jgi:myo-inositol-1(or 4)-monophosphatase
MNYLETAVEIAREAGALLAHYYERRIGYELKGAFDLVTEADRASEKLVVERLRSRFPSHAVVGEEGFGHESASEYRWYVDPLDGTTNFAHGNPVFNVALGLERSGEGVAGVVYDPIRQEMFAAEAGSGAYLNNRRIHVSTVKTMDTGLACTGFPSRKRSNDINVHFFYQIAMASHGVRRSGAAATDLAWVASGRLDMFWEFGLKPWDMAAGVLLVKEAGGRVSDMRGGKHDVNLSPTLLATNGALHEEALTFIDGVFHGERRVPMVEI